jgi:hypothetical protein
MKRKSFRQLQAAIFVFGLLITSCDTSSNKSATNSTNTETINQKDGHTEQ